MAEVACRRVIGVVAYLAVCGCCSGRLGKYIECPWPSCTRVLYQDAVPLCCMVGYGWSERLLFAAQVWVVPEVKDGKVYWKADSDSALTKVRTHVALSSSGIFQGGVLVVAPFIWLKSTRGSIETVNLMATGSAANPTRLANVVQVGIGFGVIVGKQPGGARTVCYLLCM